MRHRNVLTNAMKKRAERPSLLHYPGVAGADEAGRGPLAGPVVAAAVILPADFDTESLDDSKRLDAATREMLAVRIQTHAIWAVEAADLDEIEALNILHASMAAMARAIRRVAATKVYVDGDRLPKDLPCPGEAVVKGDGKIACIAAASILAKTTRDRLMTEMASLYPHYGFERHFGYATPEHLAAIERHGPCPIHRRTFAPFRENLQRCLSFDE